MISRGRNRPCQAELSHVVRKYTIDQVKLGGGEGFLGLDDLHVVGNAGVEALSRQVQCFSCYPKIPLGLCHSFCCLNGIRAGRLQLPKRRLCRQFIRRQFCNAAVCGNASLTTPSNHVSDKPVNRPSENDIERFVPTRRSIEATIPSRLLKIASREDKFARLREIIRDLAASADIEEGYQDMREAFEILTEREK